MPKAIWKNTVIAESDATIAFDGNQYFPADSVDAAYRTESDHTSVCGWKGTARYFNIVVDGETNRNAAWYYPAPKSAAEEVTGYVAFWKGVVVSP